MGRRLEALAPHRHESEGIMKKTQASSATYVYCVVRGARAPSLARVPSGLPGVSRPRSVKVSPTLWLVAADAPLDRYGESAIHEGLRKLEWVGECAAGHERVVEHVSRASTVVPMKLFTLFADDARAASNARRLSGPIEQIAERIDGCAEWGVRVHLDQQRARAQARERIVSRIDRGANGTNFLLRKQAEHAGAEEILRGARREAERAFANIEKCARESVLRPPISSEVAARVLLDAVFLVRAKTADKFRLAVTGAQRSLSKAGCEITVSGPWPPYHFVDRDGGPSKQ